MERHSVGRGTNSQTMGTSMQKVTPEKGRSTDLVSESIECPKELFPKACANMIAIPNQNGIDHVESSRCKS